MRGDRIMRRVQDLPDEVRRRLYARQLVYRTNRDLTPPPPERYARFGRGAVVVPPARVPRPQFVEIGDGVVIHEHCWLAVRDMHPGVAPRLVIGNGSRIGRFFHVACLGEIAIGEDVLMADHVFIADTYHGYEDADTPVIHQPMAAPKPVRIERGAFLGVRSVVLQGVTVGENAYVGACAVVTKDVPPHSVVVGNPARVIRRYDADAGEWVAVDDA